MVYNLIKTNKYTDLLKLNGTLILQHFMKLTHKSKNENIKVQTTLTI